MSFSPSCPWLPPQLSFYQRLYKHTGCEDKEHQQPEKLCFLPLRPVNLEMDGGCFPSPGVHSVTSQRAILPRHLPSDQEVCVYPFHLSVRLGALCGWAVLLLGSFCLMKSFALSVEKLRPGGTARIPSCSASTHWYHRHAQLSHGRAY